MNPDESGFCDEPWEEWYRMTPLEGWKESQKLWAFYLSMGGSLDPEPDSQSPFDPYVPRGSAPAKIPRPSKCSSGCWSP
jgi:hypothetical protein